MLSILPPWWAQPQAVTDMGCSECAGAQQPPLLPCDSGLLHVPPHRLSPAPACLLILIISPRSCYSLTSKHNLK